MARILHHNFSLARTFVGTPYYMSPVSGHIPYNMSLLLINYMSPVSGYSRYYVFPVSTWALYLIVSTPPIYFATQRRGTVLTVSVPIYTGTIEGTILRREI